MTAPNPTCTVADGAGSPQATTNGVDVTAAATIHVALSSITGVKNWALTVFGQDDLVAAPTITIDQVAKTATFTAPALPWSLILKSTVNSGVDANGVTQSSYSTTFKICCLTGGGLRLAASNETTENNATTGWTSLLNQLTRTGGSAGVTVQEEGTPLATTGTTLNFAGSALTASGGGVTKTITATGLFGANPVQCSSMDTSAAAALTIGGTNATSIDISKTSVLTKVKGSFRVDESASLNSLVVSTTAEFDGDVEVDGDIYFYNPAETFAYRITPAAIAAARVITLPLLAGDDTMVTAAFAQALTNKTIAAGSNTITGLTPTSLAASSAIPSYAIDWSVANVHTKTLGAGAQSFTFSNATDGQTIIVIVTGAASTLTWPTVLWAGGAAPTQTASGTDVYTFVKAGSTIYGSVVQAMA